MKRADWQKAKTQAAKFNNGKPIKFAKDLGLGPKLDAYHASVKKRAGIDLGADKKSWAVATQQWLVARNDVVVAAANYHDALPALQVNEQGKRVLKQALFAFLGPLTTGTGPESATTAKKAKVRVDQIKRELAARA